MSSVVFNMNEQSRYKQEKTKTRPKKVKLKSQIKSSTLGKIKPTQDNLQQECQHWGDKTYWYAYSVVIWIRYLGKISKCEIDHATGGKLRDKNAEESWALIEDPALYENDGWNDPRDFAKPVNAISLP
ncbi:hypothetical protein Tco_0481049 [Tanacetum coccineum]